MSSWWNYASSPQSKPMIHFDRNPRFNGIQRFAIAAAEAAAATRWQSVIFYGNKLWPQKVVGNEFEPVSEYADLFDCRVRRRRRRRLLMIRASFLRNDFPVAFDCVIFILKWATFFVFSIQLTVKFNVKFPNDWIWTTDLWCRERPLYQLSHNECTIIFMRDFAD